MQHSIPHCSEQLSMGSWSGTAASVHLSEGSATERLTYHSLQQLRVALGLAGCVLPMWVLQGAFGQEMVALAERMVEYDADIARRGFTAASRDLLPRIVPAVVVQVMTQIPIQGPLLIVSNHPGLYDAIALSACLHRSDVRVVAKDQPYWDSLANLSRCLITLRQDSRVFGTQMKAAIRHLAKGRCLILFPGGKIEPDPAQVKGADACLDHWSRSPEWFAGKLEELTILPAAVGGVLSDHALGHPLSWLRWSVGNRRWLAATLQFLRQSNHDVTLRVSFGEPIRYTRKDGRGARKQLRHRIRTAMRQQLMRVGASQSTCSPPHPRCEGPPTIGTSPPEVAKDGAMEQRLHALS